MLPFTDDLLVTPLASGKKQEQNKASSWAVLVIKCLFTVLFDLLVFSIIKFFFFFNLFVCGCVCVCVGGR